MTNITQFESKFDALHERDKGFAADLIKAHKRYGSWTPKQAYWADKLCKRVDAAQQPQLKLEPGELESIIELLSVKGKSAKWPKIALTTPDGKEVRLAVAGNRARHPGSVNVTDNAPYHQATWYGRIHTDGRFEGHFNNPMPADIWQLLKAFAENPAAMAKHHGQVTGHCSFCNRKLKDDRSLQAGYGPHCAKAHNLEW